ncbi:MAG: aminotransferase class III-fold pyridoxal phosphate-dependent enzyme [Gammaproteobacteria bacterium]|jgi:glutamate-1-semialdehyde 2,1-aminomutase
MWQQDVLILSTATTLTLILALLLGKLWVRLRLSRAKHPSLRGHSKWSRRISRLVPYFAYEESRFFASDGAPAAIAEHRRSCFFRLAADLKARAPHSVEATQALEAGISDLQFTNLHRVPFPYRELAREHLAMPNLVTETRGVQVRDLDGNWSYDLSGSYGVNVFGYDFYKECMQRGMEKISKLGPVLGPYHPLIGENVERLKSISGLDEVSFHMSGTEAVMQAVRLARYHTGKSHLVRFCGAYHGWWDGVQPGIGNQRNSDDVYTLEDMSAATLRVLDTRNDIACVLVNPLQALHPNADASSDAMLIASDRRTAFDREAYSSWLEELRAVCTRRGIVLILDEVFTGFRLAYRGAQEYFGVQADIVTYGKSLGGGLPVGVVCGKRELMKRYKEQQPANISFARGTFNSHPLVMAAMNEFLQRIELPYCQRLYYYNEKTWEQRRAKINQALADADLPLEIAGITSIWTLLYTRPGRYNWMLQYYLRKHGLLLSWVGSGRLIMSLDYSDEDFEQVVERFVAAALETSADGWWWSPPEITNRAIRRQFLRDLLAAKLPWMKPSRGSAPPPMETDELGEV